MSLSPLVEILKLVKLIVYMLKSIEFVSLFDKFILIEKTMLFTGMLSFTFHKRANMLLEDFSMLNFSEMKIICIS